MPKDCSRKVSHKGNISIAISNDDIPSFSRKKTLHHEESGSGTCGVGESEHRKLNLHNILLLFLQHTFRFFDSCIYMFLEICFISLCFIFTDFLTGFCCIDFLLVILSNVSDANLSFFEETRSNLYEFSTTLFVQGRDINKDRLTIVVWIQTQTCFGNSFFDILDNRLIPWLY